MSWAFPRADLEPGYGDDDADLGHPLDLVPGFGPAEEAPPPDGHALPPKSRATVRPLAAVTLAEAHGTFRRWLGADYDLDALDAVLGTAAAERLGGDPPWLLVVSGSGNAKTETVTACAGAGATVTSTITSEGALLSATSRKDRSADATGGLLRQLGDRGLLVIKDVTSILSLSRDARASVLAALREVADGFWERNVGVDGGRSLTWRGRLVVIGAVTTAWDSAHGVVAVMGDRFPLVRMDSTAGRVAAGRQALRNVEHEEAMRAELAAAVGGCLAGLDSARAVLGDELVEELLCVADLVTLARTAVERDYRGDVVNAHAPEMPTRFAKQLAQIARGLLALGDDHDHALRVALRVASDSLPPLRREVLLDVWRHPRSRTTEVQRRVQKPRSTVDRILQELHVLGLLVQAEAVGGWQYTLSDVIDTAALDAITRNGTTQGLWVQEERSEEDGPLRRGGAKSGDAPGDCPSCRHPRDSLDHLAACEQP